MALEGGEVHAGNVVYYLPVGLNSTRSALGAWLGHLQFEPPKKNMRKVVGDLGEAEVERLEIRQHANRRRHRT